VRARRALVAFVLASSSALALAQPGGSTASPRPALTGEARSLYDAGRELFRAGSWAEALAKFERASQLSNDPRLLWNMAVCERKLGHNVRVISLIEAYLEAGKAWLGDAERREAQEAARAVRAFVAEVRVESRLEGVDVFVDDARVGRTPLSSPLLVDMGKRRVRFAKAGYKESVRVEEVAGASTPVWTVDLEAEPPARSSPASPPAAPPNHAPVSTAPSRLGPLLVGGAGLALAATGGVFIGVTLGKYASLRDECKTACAPSRWEGSRNLQVTGDVLLGVGVAAVAAGIVWWAAQPPPAAARQSGLTMTF